MADPTPMLFPKDVLVCPVCANGLDGLQCSRCESEFFSLAGIPCVFTTGFEQKNLWQHQMAMMESQGREALEHMDYILQGYDVTELTRQRLEQASTAMQDSLDTILNQLQNAGLIGQFDPRLEQAPVDNPTEYYHHVLRDWAWDDEPSRHFDTHVNDANLKRVLDIWQSHNPGRMLILGAGAGRLSWDLHKALKPELTIASDINPFLLTCAHTLIRERQPITLPELYTYPQIGFPYSKAWTMHPPEDPDQAHLRWFALGADVWNMPLREASMDSIVTSWLLDVTGGDVKDLISVIGYLLKPGGQWVNTGPLLYSPHLGFELKYSAEEILEFAQMAGFEVMDFNVEEVAHMASPLNARYHHEQVLTFTTRKKTQPQTLPEPSQTQKWLTPYWLVMHHQPIPKIAFQCQMDHEFIRQVLDLVDGERSLYLIAQMVQPSLPEGVDAKDAVVALFGQILEQMASAKTP